MSDVMLHGVLRMPLPDDPAALDLMTWLQFRARARQASERIESDADEIDRLRAEVERLRAALGNVAAVAHDGGTMQLDERGALIAVRRLTLAHWDRGGSLITARSRVDAAIRASRAAGDAPVGVTPTSG